MPDLPFIFQKKNTHTDIFFYLSLGIFCTLQPFAERLPKVVNEKKKEAALYVPSCFRRPSSGTVRLGGTENAGTT